MLIPTPNLGDAELAVLAQIANLRDGRLRQYTEHRPHRWSGSLRRLTFARNIQGSNSIEGFAATLDDAAAVALGEPPLDATTETQRALAGYRDAMTYVLQLSSDPDFRYSDQLLKSLHFMMTSYHLRNHPGRWRPGPVYVQREHDGEIVHEGAPADAVPGLMQELVDALNNSVGEDPIVVAAMAHLNLVMVHPYKDGNGRMARALQSLVLARGGTLSPVFVSVEEYLGRNTQTYYEVLAEVGGGIWNPDRDATPWLRFMLTAHLRQATTLLQRIDESDQVWTALERLRTSLGFPERAMTAVFDATMGWRIRNATYRAALAEQGDELSEHLATTDLKRLVDAGLLVPVGEKRGRHYVASGELLRVRAEARAAQRPRLPDPFRS